MDYTPLAMLISLGFMVYLVCNQRIFDLDPLTRTLIVEKTDEAIVLLTNSGQVLDINPAAEKMFSVRKADVLGKEFARLGDRIPQIPGTRRKLSFPIRERVRGI
jgi:PAS domain-containing protein